MVAGRLRSRPGVAFLGSNCLFFLGIRAQSCRRALLKGESYIVAIKAHSTAGT